ncbi:hypothetical protein [Streptomyces hyaluromycini]|uniref:hypothetical protein n=1 Tax=Streptomyces hyaluromycini TaxID=1377993 RepID=UPI000B5CA094|nr:hypothetical protein [Streptomyces hyaluromycini]
MFEFELHRIRSAELRRQAADARLAREAVRSRRAARQEARDAAAVQEAHTDRRGRRRLPRAA